MWVIFTILIGFIFYISIGHLSTFFDEVAFRNIFPFMCSMSHMLLWAYMYICAHRWKQKVIFLRSYLPCGFWDNISFSLSWSSPSRLRWQVSKTFESLAMTLYPYSSAGIAGANCHAWIFLHVFLDRTRVPMLARQALYWLTYFPSPILSILKCSY